MTGHTTKGWPYAQGTDALTDWPAASLELANKLDGMRDFVFLPSGADGISGGVAGATVEMQDGAGVKARIAFTPPVAGMFTYRVQSIGCANDNQWTRAIAYARIRKASDNTDLTPEVKAEMYGYLTGGVGYAPFRVENRCAVAAGVPIYGTAFFQSVTGTWNYWAGVSYMRAFAEFVPAA